MDQSAVVKDLYDSVERENDLRDQLKFAEDESKNARKKISDLEEENENLNLQLRKMSTAKLSKPSTPDDENKGLESSLLSSGSYSDLSNEREMQMKVELDLAEVESSRLRKKTTEMEVDNDELIQRVKNLEKKLEEKVEYLASVPPPSPKSYYEDKIKAMTMELDEVRWKVIEKDREIERLNAIKRDVRSSFGRLTPPMNKTKSPDADQHVVDLKRQIGDYKQEAECLRMKLVSLERRDGELCRENTRLVTALRNANSQTEQPGALDEHTVDLKHRIKVLIGEKSALKAKLRNVTDGLAVLTRDVASMECRNCKLPQSSITWTKPTFCRQISKETDELLKLTEKELGVAKKKMADLKNENSRLGREMQRAREDAACLKENSESKPDDEKNQEQLKTAIKDYKDEIQDLLVLLRSREDSTEELEAEVISLRTRIQKLQDDARKTELELLEELEMSQQKNDVLSNLLDIVSDRANANEKELEKLLNHNSSERSNSEVSELSHVSTGSDDVFQGHAVSSSEDVIVKDWDNQMSKRVNCLEKLLAEERQKVLAAEKRLVLSTDDRLSSGMSDDVKLRMREKELLQNELTVSQQHLIIAGDQIRGLTERLAALEHSNLSLINDYAALETEVEMQLKDDTHVDTDIIQTENSSLTAQLEHVTKTNQQLQEEKSAMKIKVAQISTDLEAYKKKSEELNYKVAEINEIWVSKSRASEKEKEELDIKVKELEVKLFKVTDVLQKVNLDAKQKSAVIAKTEKLMWEKDDVIKKREEIIKQQEDIIKQRDGDFKTLMTQLGLREGQLRELTDAVRSRDDRLRDMEAVVDRANDRGDKVVTGEPIKEMLKKLADKESEIRDLKARFQQEFTSSASDITRESAAFKQMLENQTTSREKVTKERDQLSAELSTLRNEINEKEANWKLEQSNVLTALKMFKEKYGTLESMSRVTENEMVSMLNENNATLIREKETLGGEIRKLQIRLDQAVAEKCRIADESRVLGERMLEEVNRLKTQAQLSIKVHEETRVLRAELVAMKARYEHRIDHLQHDYNAVRASAEKLQKERDLHQDLVHGIQRGMGQLKVRYTHDMAAWQQEKLLLERKLKELENSQVLLAKMAGVTEELNAKLYEESRLNADLETRLATEKTLCDMERADMHSRLNEMEEKMRGRGEPTNDSDLVAAWQEERNEQKRLISEAQRLSMDLQRQLKLRDESHSRERREIGKKFDEEKRTLELSKMELEKRLTVMEMQYQEVPNLRSKITDCESRLEADRHVWQREKQELHKRLSDSRDVLTKQNNKIEQVLHLLCRLRELAAMITDAGRGQYLETSTSECMDAAKIQKSLDQAVINYIRESMVQLHSVTSDLTTFVDATTAVLPTLKRSASSTQVELTAPDTKPEPRLLQEPTKPPQVPRSADSSPTRGREINSRRHSGGVISTNGRLPPLCPVPANKASAVSRTLHTSRSVSPDISRQRPAFSPVRKITRYPDPPPSFIISPPPQSPLIPPKPHLTKTDASQKMYPQPQPCGASRQLIKSISFDTAQLLSQRDMPRSTPQTPEGTPTEHIVRTRRDSNEDTGRLRHRRSGQSLDRNILYMSPRTSGSLDRLSPLSARKKFFQEFHDMKTTIQDFSPWVRRKIGLKSPEPKVTFDTNADHRDSIIDQYAIPSRHDQVFSPVHYTVHRDAVSPIPDVPWTERVNIVDNSGADIYENVLPVTTTASSSQASITSSVAKTSLPATKDKRKLFKKPASQGTKTPNPSGFGSDLFAAVRRKLRPAHKKTLATDEVKTESPATSPVSDDSSDVSEIKHTELGLTEESSSPDGVDGTEAFPLYEDITPMTPISFSQSDDGSPNFNKPPAPPTRQPPRRWRSRSAERITPQAVDRGHGLGKQALHADVVTPVRFWQFNETPV